MVGLVEFLRIMPNGNGACLCWFKGYFEEINLVRSWSRFCASKSVAFHCELEIEAPPWVSIVDGVIHASKYILPRRSTMVFHEQRKAQLLEVKVVHPYRARGWSCRIE